MPHLERDDSIIRVTRSEIGAMVGIAKRLVLKQAKGVTLVETTLRTNRGADAKLTYTVTAYWAATHFYDGDNFNAAEEAFERALARAPQRAHAS